MGIAERDYNRAPTGRPPRGVFGHAHVVGLHWLIVINVVVFALDQMTQRQTVWGASTEGLLTRWGYFSKVTVIDHLQLWRVITFQFLHASLTHIFFNMLALYFFGPLIEQYLGPRRFLVFYLLCGAAGAGMYLLLWRVGFFDRAPEAYPEFLRTLAHLKGGYTPLVGASAGIFGVLIAAAQVAPNSTVMLMFPPIPMRLRTLAWIMIAIAVYTVLTTGRNAGGEAAHLGGAALGALLIRFPQWLNFADAPRRKPRRDFFMDDRR